MSLTWRFGGALAVAAVLFYYGATSEVAWLFLLAYWIAALMVAASIYAGWNWSGLSGGLGVAGTISAPDSPIETLPEQLLRTGPIPAPIFEGDRADIQLRLCTNGGARGPARLSGLIGGVELRAATGVVPKAGWIERRTVGPMARGTILAENSLLEASDPLGFFRFRRKGADGEIGIVLPRFMSLSARPEARELEASVAAPRAGSGVELFGVREYRPGDPLRRIHWRSSARLGELVVREYEPPGVQTVGIFCDPNPPSREIADQVARLAASEVWECIRGGGRVVLWAPGHEPSLPNEARSLWALLEWLARYPQPASAASSAPPPALRATSPPREELPSVSDAVGVTAGASAPLIEALEIVRQRGGRIRAWVVGDAEMDLDAPLQRVGTAWPL
ncbi:MAG: DUF58 domain-containing protein [Candidatus Dormibacteraeota bacterium]|nr:DUF58 domain-containing protein [Candidatus Dormibacteraeota bacterium]